MHNATRFIFVFLFILLSIATTEAQTDTIFVSDRDYKFIGEYTEFGRLEFKNKPDSVLNGLYKVKMTNSWHRDMLVKNNLLNGNSSRFHVNRITEKNHFVDGYKDGKQYTYHDDGSIYKIENFENGMHIDTTFAYYSDGSLSYVSPYKDGHQDGKFYSYDRNGNILIEAEYKKGHCIGKWIEQTSDGTPKKIEEYDEDGNLRKVSNFWNGLPYIILNFDENRIYNGKHEVYDYKTGKLKFIHTYENGYRKGKQTIHHTFDDRNYLNYTEEYDMNGKGQIVGSYIQKLDSASVILVEGNFKDGTKDGKWIFKTPENRIYHIDNYENGFVESSSHFEFRAYTEAEESLFLLINSFGIPLDTPTEVEQKQATYPRPFFLFSE